MAKWTREKIAPDANGEYPELNGGNEYTIDDDVAIKELNAIVNNSLYASDKVDTVIGEAEEIVEQGKTDISTQTEQGKTELNKIVDDAEALVDKANTSINTVVGTANEALSKVDRVLANQGYYGSNPNILINGDFRVNQRGLEEYKVTLDERIKYSADRWKLSIPNTTTEGFATYNVTTKTFTNNSNGPAYLVQTIEKSDILVGRNITMSLCDGNGVIWSGSGIVNNTSGQNSVSVPIKEGTTTIGWFRLWNASNSLYQPTIHLNSNTALTIKWAKIEIGGIATEFTPRNYVEELIDCQRYYIKLKRDYHALDNPAFIGTFFALSATYGYMLIDLPYPLMKSPDRKNTKLLYKIGHSNAAEFTTLSGAAQDNYVLKLKLYGVGSGFTAGGVYPVCVSGDEYILELDADY